MKENIREREAFGAQVPSQWSLVWPLLLSFLLLALHCIYPSGYLAHKSKYCLSIWKRSLGPLKSNLTSPALARLVGAWTELPGPIYPYRSPFSCSSSQAQSAPSWHHSKVPPSSDPLLVTLAQNNASGQEEGWHCFSAWNCV